MSDGFAMLSLFPTPVGRFALGREFSEAELDFMLSRPMRKSAGNHTSIDSDVLSNPEVAGIREFIQASVDRYFEDVYAPAEEVSLKITQSWLNVTERGGFHHVHSHQNSLVSGVFYVKADKEQDKIHFYRSNPQQIDIYSQRFNLFNSPSWWLETGTCDLLLFPSHLTHDVQPVSTEKRISLSFNTFPIGWIGDRNCMKGLEVIDLKG